MTRRILMSGTAILILSLLALVAGANPKPNFTGAWVMDVARSFGQPPNMQQTMTVTQTEDQITVETKLILPDNERIVKDTYVLDGKEHEFTPPLPLNAPPNTPAPKGKRTAAWLPNTTGILVTELITNETPKGPATTQIARKWLITNDGELAITMFIDAPNGSYETKRVFVKKS
ncbi:MAG TPA: hypothetical protein VGN90_12785 [Pyrinomonadaceae bacterium]|jgi:hypothetical protein|nr:hypothetical protein [Pyrinomonadaceae bacterium]